MTVRVLIPVFNRFAVTQSMLEYLRAQRADDPPSIVVVGDGSTDGTAEYLHAQKDITALKGDGSLWWGRAVDLPLRQVLEFSSEQDWILLVNNDTRIESGFVQKLLDTARQHAPAAVGCVIRDIEPPHRLLSIGPQINPWRFRIKDAIEDSPHVAGADVVPVDALSGQGFTPCQPCVLCGGRVRCLPHYLADYELVLRVRSAGWRLLVSTTAAVYSADEYGNAYRASCLWDRILSVYSPSFVPARLGFCWSASSPVQRLTLPFRAAVHALISLRLRRA